MRKSSFCRCLLRKCHSSVQAAPQFMIGCVHRFPDHLCTDLQRSICGGGAGHLLELSKLKYLNGFLHYLYEILKINRKTHQQKLPHAGIRAKDGKRPLMQVRTGCVHN